jgi:6-phosphogluconolactonase
VSLHLHVSATADEAASACARYIASVLSVALAGEPAASLAVSGGRTPALMFDALSREDLDWRRLHVFWVDERGVPPEDPMSNFAMAERHLIRPARIPPKNVHRIETELGAEEAAARYEEEIRRFFGLRPGELPRFDMIQCGIGADTHTASLFPGEPLIEDREGVAAAVQVAKLGQWRITLLPGVLLAAQHTAVLASGADKAEALRRVVDGPYDPLQAPAQLLRHHGRNVHWFIDRAAAALLD